MTQVLSVEQSLKHTECVGVNFNWIALDSQYPTYLQRNVGSCPENMCPHGTRTLGQTKFSFPTRRSNRSAEAGTLTCSAPGISAFERKVSKLSKICSKSWLYSISSDSLDTSFVDWLLREAAASSALAIRGVQNLSAADLMPAYRIRSNSDWSPSENAISRS